MILRHRFGTAAADRSPLRTTGPLVARCRRRVFRLSAAVVALALANCGQAPGGAIKQPGAVVTDVVAEPLDITQPERNSIGLLRYRGGFSITSSDERFGGLSGLLVSGDGSRFLALSDLGYWVRGALRYDDNGDLVGASDVDMVPLRRVSGEPTRWGSESDAESLARDPGGAGEIFVGFERTHRIWQYNDPDASARPVATPVAVADQPSNGGIEALTTLADGRLVAISEEHPAGQGQRGWFATADGRWEAFTWLTSERFRPTGAATMPNGDLLVLERRFPPVGARLRLAPATAVVAGAVVDGEEIARLEGSITVDNMEGVDVRQGPNGGNSLIYLLSDDNFNVFQRTLIMMFELAAD